VCNTKQSWYHKVGWREIWYPQCNVHCHLTWHLVIHNNHMWWERPLLRVTAVKITRCGWDSLKWTHICIDDKSVFCLHLWKKRRLISIGFGWNFCMGGGCELYLRAWSGWIASARVGVGAFSMWMSVLTSLLMLVLNHFTLSTLCSSVYIQCVHVS
jgi:hypothetical protein